jgi:signal transduction histidine kinase/DNA-binding response OmpR family regulator
MKLKQLYKMLFFINISALIFVVIMISEYQKSNKELELAYQMQHRSLILADELRQSSDDLTRMARTYVVTGNEHFKKQFQTVLDIRNGVLPRPKQYNHIYWDFLTLNDEQAILDGEKIPLKELMRQAGFPETELELLYKSQKESDDLTQLETKAMNAVKGIFQDDNGEYTIQKEPDLEFAAKIMHGEEYHRAKVAIMKPLDQFYQAFEARTQQQVNQAHEKVKQLESSVALAIFILILLVLFSFFILLSRIFYPLENLKNSMIGLSHNDMETPIPEHDHLDEVGDMINSVEVFKQNAIKLFQKEEILKKAMIEAKNANRSKSVFLANMSHELRTPLNAILGFTTLLKKADNLSLTQKENLQIISNSGEHLLKIINEILELSKIEAGKIEIVNGDCDFYQIIEDIKGMFDTRYENKQLKFEIEMEPNLPQYIVIDEQRLRQILINLLGNALKFTEIGSVLLKVNKKDKKLHFEIIDTGIGINENDLQTIFKPFEQVKSEKYIQKGTGLGLPITKELVTLMGGEIDVSSKYHKGSRFTFDILYSLSNETDIRKKFTNTKVLKTTKQTKQHTVLVVDDIKENRSLLVQMLHQYNIHTIEVTNGEEALQTLKDTKFDLIFMDISMPILNGLEATKLIKQNKDFQQIPVIIVSANVLKSDELQSLNSGADAFMAKPIDEMKLCEYLQEFLDIKLIYEEQESIKNKTIQLSLTAQKEFQKAIESLDIEMIKKIVEKENITKSQKEQIIELANRFEFETLKDLLKI